ncbi:hypothetical protein MNBD_GAMMA11-1446 [hydrothermal vent metagenome]|uniref:Mobile element protein n=1 Tax=hydrothermal vent metagenome TaxID=652676 RepID=A0A3B0WPP9_9ZZZZ
MSKPRYAQVLLEATPYYHCFSRCVRRAFLCGLTEISYEHREQCVRKQDLYSTYCLRAWSLYLCHNVKPLSSWINWARKRCAFIDLAIDLYGVMRKCEVTLLVMSTFLISLYEPGSCACK